MAKGSLASVSTFLRGDAAGPEHRHFPWGDVHRLAVIRPSNIRNADLRRRTDVHRRTVDPGHGCGDGHRRTTWEGGMGRILTTIFP